MFAVGGQSLCHLRDAEHEAQHTPEPSLHAECTVSRPVDYFLSGLFSKCCLPAAMKLDLAVALALCDDPALRTSVNMDDECRRSRKRAPMQPSTFITRFAAFCSVYASTLCDQHAVYCFQSHVLTQCDSVPDRPLVRQRRLRNCGVPPAEVRVLPCGPRAFARGPCVQLTHHPQVFAWFRAACAPMRS